MVEARNSAEYTALAEATTPIPPMRARGARIQKATASDVDTIIVPIGGGGLISGVSVAASLLGEQREMLVLQQLQVAHPPAERPDDAGLQLVRHIREELRQRARDLLDNWAAARSKFVKVFPSEYKRALSEMYERQVMEEPATPEVEEHAKEAVAAK